MQKFCKIMIVDDEYIIRQSIKQLLDWEKYGYKIIGEASNGKEAIELAQNEQPDIVLTDISMPVMNGIELTKELHKMNKYIQVIILSGYNDFEYVKGAFQNSAVDYMLKPLSDPIELLEILQKAVNRIPSVSIKGSSKLNIENFIKQYILGLTDILPKQQIDKQFPLPCFRLFGVNKKICKSNSVINSFMQSGVFEMLGVYHPYPLDINDDIALVILNYSHTDEATISVAVRNTVEKLSAFSSSLFFVLSDTFYNIEEIKNVYTDNFCKLTERKFYYKNISLLPANKIADNTQSERFDSKKYSSYLATLNFKEALAMLSDYVVKAINIYRMDELKLKVLVESMLYSLITSLEELNPDTDNIIKFKLSSLARLENSEYAEDFLKNFEDIYRSLYDAIQSYSIKTGSDSMNKITNYIKEHYSEPLTLNDIAKKFNFSYYYLSSYFSAHSAEGFNEYLNKVRIKQALKLLTSKDTSIAAISSMVGYSDHSYFCKVFKKFTGTTPSKYRKNKTASSV